MFGSLFINILKMNYIKNDNEDIYNITKGFYYK